MRWWRRFHRKFRLDYSLWGSRHPDELHSAYSPHPFSVERLCIGEWPELNDINDAWTD